MDRFARGLIPPYYAVMFTNLATDDTDGYGAMADAMVNLAPTIDGYLGVESTRDNTGLGITISYWRDEDAITEWREHARHAVAQKLGKERWYEHYELRVAKIERAYSGPDGR
ncbi:MAG: antibiotic biosynthesis monooxygenase family protein [Pikeienuella sp.]